MSAKDEAGLLDRFTAFPKAAPRSFPRNPAAPPVVRVPKAERLSFRPKPDNLVRDRQQLTARLADEDREKVFKLMRALGCTVTFLIETLIREKYIALGLDKPPVIDPRSIFERADAALDEDLDPE